MEFADLAIVIIVSSVAASGITKAFRSLTDGLVGRKWWPLVELLAGALVGLAIAGYPWGLWVGCGGGTMPSVAIAVRRAVQRQIGGK